ncbi:uncharacterized protein LOC131237161 isoform X2 [Magnolia sinica]|uniref:uncharacterized protein LOC131237161 isoform X2 n=1 Tax=Magnolia sinica TaxID=86752 RepID=UPI0026586C34|nr:uncharacterized protein LOC131237161 isoform X2 [Magnolia sinica]
MDILSAFPSTMLRGIDQRCNGFGSKCASRYSAVGDISRSKALTQSQNKASPHVKSKENLQCTGPSQQAYDGMNESSRSLGLDASGVNSLAAPVTDSPIAEKPVKNIAKKKYRKRKAKSTKKSIDDAVIQGVAEVASQTCPVAETGSTVIAPNVYVEDIAPVSYQSPKEIGNFNDSNINTNCNRTLTTSSSEFCLETADTSCFAISNEANCTGVERGFSSLEESASKDPNVDESSDTRYTSKADEKIELVPASAVVESVSCCEPTVKCLNEANNRDGQLFSKFSSGKNSNLDRGQTQCDILDSGQGNTSISGRGSSEVIHGLKGLNTDMKEIISDQGEVLSLGYISEDNPRELGMLGGARESVNGGSADRIKSSSHCSSISDVHAVTTGTKVEHRRKLSQSSNDTVHMSSRGNNPSQTGKDNSQFIWKKNQKSIRDLRSHGAKRSNPVHVQMDVGTHEVKHNPCSTDPLLPSPVISSTRPNSLTRKVKEFVNNEKGMYGTHPHVLVESLQWVAQQRFHGGNSQYVSQSHQDDIMGNKDWGKCKEKPNQLPKPENIYHFKKGSWANKGNLYKLRNKAYLSQKEPSEVSTKPCLYKSTDNNDVECLPSDPARSSLVQVNVPHRRISSGPSDQAPFHEVQTHTWMKIPRTEHVLVGSLHASLGNRERRPACLEIELAYEDSVRQDFASRASIQKWIPVGRKHSWIVKGNGVVDAKDLKDKPISYYGKAEMRQEGYRNSACGPASSFDCGLASLTSNLEDPTTNKTLTVLQIESEITQFDKPSTAEGNYKEQSRREYVASDSELKNIPLLYIGSQMAVEALNEAYRLQMASECVQLATGCPLAEFERLLHSASPVICPAYVLQHCEECSGNQLSFNNSLCKHQIPNIPLGTVWNWYEKPGSYGLEVKAEDSENLKGLDADGISFHAHFVPFLSAVQLFSHLRDSKCHRTEKLGSEVPEKGEDEQRLSLTKTCTNIPCSQATNINPCNAEKTKFSVPADLVENSLKSSNSLGSDANDSSDLSSVFSSRDDIELVFEFFEYEQPQQRKPLYEKIMDLIKTGNSNHQVFGDPSKLKCMNLHDLHPASWYSVAWYPIYRIPEGNFRASFLTYHSLGHLVQRCISSDSVEANSFCIVSPVLGLQSYNAQEWRQENGISWEGEKEIEKFYE